MSQSIRIIILIIMLLYPCVMVFPDSDITSSSDSNNIESDKVETVNEPLHLINKDAFDVISDIKNGIGYDSNSHYMWKGMIFDLDEQDEKLIITMIKARWLPDDRLTHIKFILETRDKKQKELVKTIGLYNKFIVILKITDLMDGEIPVGIPIIIKKV